MAEQQISGVQLKFRSSGTGDWTLDTYLENAEIGGLTLAQLLDQIFDTNGVPVANGLYVWKGSWVTATAYSPGDVVRDSVSTNLYVAVTSYTSDATIAADIANGDLEIVVDLSDALAAKTAAEAAQAAAEASEAAVDAVALPFNFDTSTSMADPGTGEFRFDNAVVASVANVAFSNVTSATGNPDVSDYIVTMDDSTSTLNGHFIFVEEGSPSNFAIFSVGAVTDNTSWLQVGLTHVDSTGSFGAGDTIRVQFVRTGDQGAVGPSGPVGIGLSLALGG